jgi:heme-degrading monooxygenase HmoA
MYIRSTRVQSPPDKVQDAIHNFETNVVKRMSSVPGYQGAVLLVNRQTGEGMGVTYWESARALGASEQSGIDSRTQAATTVPGTRIINVERGEIMIMDRAAAPTAGTFIRGVSGSGDPDKLDAGVNFARTKALPVLKALKGYRAFIVSIDRQTGRVLTSSVWDTKADLDASESKIAPIRAEFARVVDIKPETLKVEIFESAVVELSAAASALTTART